MRDSRSRPGCRALFRVERSALKLAILALLLVSGPLDARGDGPHIAFHGTGGAYTITLFSAPDPLVAGPVDLTLLVQAGPDNSMVPAQDLDARGELQLPGHAAVPFRLTPGGGMNRQLSGATIRLSDAGNYAFTLHVVRSGAAAADFRGSLPVEANHGQRNTVLLSVFLPVLLIALFLVNQSVKRRQLSSRGRKAAATFHPADGS